MDALGTPTRVWEYGDPEGAPLILIHGFRGDHHGLELIAQSLPAYASGLRVIVPDLPGFGKTPPLADRRHDLRAFSEWLQSLVHGLVGGAAPGDQGSIPPFSVLGHSFGSLIVSQAIADGLSPRNVILINPISSPALSGPNAVMTQLARAYYRAAGILPPRAGRALLANPLIVRLMSEVMAKTKHPPLRRWIHDQHARYFSSFSDTQSVMDAFSASASHTVTEFMGAFTVPTLIIAGDQDDIAPLVHQIALRHRIAHSELRIIPGVGHLVHYEAPEDAAFYTAQFLARLSLARRERSA